MTKLLTAHQMRATEAAAIARGDARGAGLMERAGEGVVAACLATWPELEHPPEGGALVLCGPGNNGGDGFVIARLLAARGWRVTLGFLGDPASLPPDAALNHARWQRLGAVAPLTGAAVAGAIRATPALVVDALFGTGLTRPLGAEVALILSRALAGAQRSVAVDLLSGLCADSGRALGGAPAGAVDLTVTFHCPKPGHFLAEGGRATARLSVVDIGLPSAPGQGARDGHDAGDPPPAEQFEAELSEADLFEDPGPLAAIAGKPVGGHKFGQGHLLVLSGGAGASGAARLAARAALRVGAGLVTLGVPPAAMAEVAAQITALMMRPLAGTGDLEALLEDRRLGVLCLGPGLGLGAGQAALVRRALGSGRQLVLDADALTLCAGPASEAFARLAGAAGSSGARAVLTPHDGEFARLFPDLSARLGGPAQRGPAWSRLDAARQAARRSGCVVLLKGADTVIAAPDGRSRIHAALRDRAAPWLATAGSGDVLSGLIAGLLARGLTPFDAAAMGAWLHVSCARAFGPGLIAEDLPEQLPVVLRALGSGAES